MITARHATYQETCKLFYDDELYDRISDDNCPGKEDFELPPAGYEAIGGYISGEIASIFFVYYDHVYKENNHMHFMVLKPYRKYARKLLDASFKIYPQNVFCEIPSLYRAVINFAKNYGFKEMQIRKQEYKKNGQLYDMHRLIYKV